MSLTIEGIYSYHQQQTIDFRRLSEAQLFGIFGPVGAGKSTILEAMALALFGEAERLNQKDDRNYNMMNLKSGQASVEFTFQAYDGAFYSFSHATKRSRKDFTEIKSPVRKVYRKLQEDEDWVPVKKTAEEIIHLSYENFRRTIIIPQGRFQEFLQLKSKDRTDMVREIFNLQRFEFSEPASMLQRQVNEIVHSLRGELKRYEHITEEAIREKEGEVALQQQEVHLTECALTECRKKEMEQDQLRKIYEELQARKKDLALLEAQVPFMEEKQKKLQKYRYGVHHFKTNLARLADLEIKARDLSHRLEQTSARYKNADHALSEKKARFSEIEKDFQNIDLYKTRAGDCLTIIEIRQEEEERNKLQAKHKIKMAELEEADKCLHKATEKLQEQKSSLSDAKNDPPDMETLKSVEAWLIMKEKMEKDQLSAQKEVNDCADKMDRCKQQARECLELYFPEWDREADFGQALHLFDKELELLEGEKIAATKKAEALRWKKELCRLSGSLEPGDPCPVCGAKEHPEPLSGSDVSAQLSEEEARLEAIKKKRGDLNKGRSSLAQLQHVYSIHEKDFHRFQANADECADALARHQQSFGWDPYRHQTLESISEALSEAKKKVELIGSIEGKITEWEREKESRLASRNKVAKAGAQLEGDLKAASAKIGVLCERLSGIRYEEWTESTKRTRQMAEEWKNKTETLTRTREELQTSIHREELEIASLKKELDMTHKEMEENTSGVESFRHRLNESLLSSPFSSLEEVTALLAESFDVVAADQEIAGYRQRLFEVRNRIGELENQTGGKFFDPAGFEQLKEDIRVLNLKEQKAREKMASLETLLKELKDGLGHKCSLSEKLGQQEVRAGNLEELVRLFKGSGFVNFVSTVYLKNLCRAANERFYGMTNRQFRLDLDENNNFIVADYLNEGKKRLAKTLSGGQTFQASLCLALALADGIQRENKMNQNFFFLDEGFGSLDKEALQFVFTALKALRKENRIVGIISHVEELQQEIEVYLRVKNHHEKGSCIENSWD